MPEIIPNWHPILVHFTIGLLGAAVVFYVLSLAIPQWSSPLRLAGRLNLWAGALVTVGTLLTGWHAYNTVPHDAASHAVMTLHRNWALITGVLFIALALLLAVRVGKGLREGPVFVLAMVLAGAPLTITGYLGGELVFRHGVGVLSLPDVDDHHHHGESGHAHDHDHGHPDHGEHNGEPEEEGHDHGHDHDNDQGHDHGHPNDGEHTEEPEEHDHDHGHDHG